MAFSVKAWLDRFGSGGSYDQPTDTGDTPDTPVDAAGLRNMETRLSAYTDSTVTAHTGDTSAAHAASAISFTPTGTIAATDAQAAVAEAASEAASNLTTGLATKADLTGGHVPIAQLGSGTPASGKYVDGASGAWLSIPAQSGSGAILAWATSTVYAQGQTVTNSGHTYTANDAHTAGATFAGDLAGHWTLLPVAKADVGLGNVDNTADASKPVSTAQAAADALALAKASNLSDLANAGTARTNLGLGTVAVTALDVDGTLAANSDVKVASQKAVKTYVDAHASAVSSVAGKTGAVTLSTSDVGGSFTGGAFDLLPVDEVTIPTSTGAHAADDISGADGDAVSSWTSSGVALAQATGGSQPTLEKNGPNGHAYVRFGSGKWMSKTLALSASVGYTIAMVGRSGGSVGNKSIIGPGILNDYNGRICGPGQNATASAAATLPGWAIYRLQVIAGGTWKLYRNGVPIAAGTGAGNVSTLYVGQDSSGTFFAGDWDIAHIDPIASTVMPDEGQALDVTLGRKYGIRVGPDALSVRVRTNQTVSGQTTAVALPESRVDGNAVPLLLFSHGGSGGYDSVWSYGDPGPTADAALGLGFAVAASDLHGDSQGNAQQLADNLALVNYVKTLTDVSKIVLLGQSLGGLPSLNMITKQTLAATGIPVVGALLIYPVIDQRTYPHAGESASSIAAYGLTNGTLAASPSIGATSISSTVSYPAGTVLQLDVSPGAFYELVTVTGSPTGSGPYTIPITATTKAHSSGVIVSDYGTKIEGAGYNPATRPASEFGNLRYRVYGSASDAIVDLAANVTPFLANIAATAREAALVTTRGNHGDLSNFQARDQAQFLLRCVNDSAIVGR